jgi:hypothetical protein
MESEDCYRTCEEHCNHDLAPGVTIAELLGGDGPHPPGYLLVSLSGRRAAVVDEGADALDDGRLPLHQAV